MLCGFSVNKAVIVLALRRDWGWGSRESQEGATADTRPRKQLGPRWDPRTWAELVRLWGILKVKPADFLGCACAGA